MNVPRRAFLGLAGSTLVSCGRPAPRLAAAVADPWADVRAQFNLAPDYVHLAAFMLASHPKPVRDAIDTLRRKIDENTAHYVEEHWDELYGRVTTSAARYLGVRPTE